MVKTILVDLDNFRTLFVNSMLFDTVLNYNILCGKKTHIRKVLIQCNKIKWERYTRKCKQGRNSCERGDEIIRGTHQTWQLNKNELCSIQFNSTFIAYNIVIFIAIQ